ncbi:hypothetical protein SNEBB_000330 [Seison nebaliae]|nr:hypothetical protein SNEBB_000330 [Seison nebaliae]
MFFQSCHRYLKPIRQIFGILITLCEWAFAISCIATTGSRFIGCYLLLIAIIMTEIEFRSQHQKYYDVDQLKENYPVTDFYLNLTKQWKLSIIYLLLALPTFVPIISSVPGMFAGILLIFLCSLNLIDHYLMTQFMIINENDDEKYLSNDYKNETQSPNEPPQQQSPPEILSNN